MNNSHAFKECCVPECYNSSYKNPSKLFVHVPAKKTIRVKWFKLANILDPEATIIKQHHLYFCGDHFDLPNDMENYMEYNLMGSVRRVLMKPKCIPTKFPGQTDSKKRSSNETELPCIFKKQRLIDSKLINKSEEYLEENQQVKFIKTSSTSDLKNEVKFGETSCGTSSDTVLQMCKENFTEQDIKKTAHKSTQVSITCQFRSKAIQTKNNSVDHMTSPIKAISTSPFKLKTSTLKPGKKLIFEEQSDSDISYAPSVTHKHSSPTISLETDTSEVVEIEEKHEESQIVKYTLLKISNNPRSYIGLQKNCYFLTEILKKELNIPTNHILMSLKKIRLNNSFRELGDDFSLSPTYASKIFSNSIPLLASCMRPFIVPVDKHLIKANLPMAFRHKYHQVCCIIDCFEIEIEKPSNAINQSLTWSEYKKTNTIKYLVSCTPNGLVNYISPGYGGRITDTCLVETCDFINCLQSGMCVMADRGFKHVEPYLRKKGVELVRPPSVSTGTKLTKSEARQTKQIASLRIHVERAIRRIREFHMLKPHACVNHYLVKILDDVVTIVCGLINLQDSLIT